MSLRRRSVLLQVALLVLIPLILLVGSFTYIVTTSASTALTLNRSKVVMDQLRLPVAALQQALSHARAQVIIYYVRPTPAAPAALQRQQAVTDRAVHSFMVAAESLPVQQSASAGGEKAIAEVDGALASLPGLQAKIASRSIGEQQAFTAYNDMIGASYLVLEQAIIQEGNSAQVLPAIAVVELAVSNEYLQQESALLNGDFAARRFPASAHLAFTGLVGAHRLLYQQSYSYLSQPDRSILNHDVGPAAAGALTAMENKLVASNLPHLPPPVSPALWNAAVTAVSTQTERAVGQAEVDLAASARSQADAKLRNLYRWPRPGRGRRIPGAVPVDRHPADPAAARAAGLGSGDGQRPSARRGAASAYRGKRGRRRADAAPGTEPGRNRPGQGGIQCRAADCGRSGRGRGEGAARHQ
jgi:hypothetical protein